MTTSTTHCQRSGNITRSLLGYGVLAGPFYVTVSLAQALTREGFDLTRHAWSQLANGDLGWIQVVNLILSGAMVVAFAVGLHRAGAPAARLIGGYGIGMIVSGIFPADPGNGFPAGTPAGPGEVTWQGMVHFAAAGVGFLCLVAACLLTARRFRADGRRDWAVYSLLTGLLFLVGFAGLAAGGGSAATIVAFIAVLLLAWSWIAAVAVHQYRRVPR